MAEESRMNLAALQQRDPYITEIIDKAVKVALYKFSQKQNKWSATEIEGSLFVYKRSASPSYGLMILNRKDLNNLVQPLTSQVEFHLNTPFLLFKKLSDDLEDAILGIWFVDTGECLRLTEKIQSILHEVSGRGDKGAHPESGHHRPSMLDSSPGHNILSLLNNAQKTYEQEHGATFDHSDPRPIKHPSGDASGMSQISLDELFRTVNQHSAKAGMVDTGTDTVKHPVYARSLSVAEVEAQASPDTRHPLLKLISSKTVEEIEKQHIEEHKRLKAANAVPTVESTPLPSRPSDPSSDLMQILRQARPKQQVGGEGDSGDQLAAQHGVAAVKKLITSHDPLFGTNRGGFVPVPSTAHSVNEIESNMVYPVSPDSTVPPDMASARRKETSANLPTMLKPSDLDPSLAKPKSPPAVAAAYSASALLTPQAFLDPPGSELSTPSAAPTLGISPLTRDQLQQAMIHLIKNDSNFLTSLHLAYLESFHATTGNKL